MLMQSYTQEKMGKKGNLLGGRRGSLEGKNSNGRNEREYNQG